jgi:hypothetical protein
MGGFESGHDKAAEAYWQEVAAQGAASLPPSRYARRRSRAGKVTNAVGDAGTEPPQANTGISDMPDEADPTDPTDPVVVIAGTVLKNVAITKELVAESQTTRQALAETERKMALRTDTASAELRSLTLAVQQLTAREETILRLRAARWVWGFAGLILGAVLTSVAVTELPMWWRQIFG